MSEPRMNEAAREMLLEKIRSSAVQMRNDAGGLAMAVNVMDLESWLAFVPATPEPPAALDDRPNEMSASEAVFAFAGWLSARRGTIPLGATHDSAIVAELVAAFCDRHGFADPRDGWDNRIVPEPQEPALEPTGGSAAHDEHGASCYDCNRPYGDEHGFPDLIIPYRVWKEITPTQDDGGLLCPSCICKRLHDRGLRCEGAFMSGPINSVSRAMMSALRGVENIELAIGGRENRWAQVRGLVNVACARCQGTRIEPVGGAGPCRLCLGTGWQSAPEVPA